MKQLKAHIVLLSVLVVISIVLAFTDSENTSADVDLQRFQVQDTSMITGLILQKGTDQIQIERKGDRWIIDGSLKADPALIKILNAIMSRVEVVRPVSAADIGEVRTELQQNGVEVRLMGGSDLNLVVGGNPSKTQSYFATQDLGEIFLVSIPGYDNYLSGVFELTKNQWRDRVLFSSTWRSLQGLSIEYLDDSKEDLSIAYANDFINVKGVNALDTMVLMSYLNQYERFQHNDFLEPGQFPKYDSLLNAKAIVKIKVSDINIHKNVELLVYPKIPTERFYLLSDQQNQMIVIDENRMNSLLKSGQDFKAQ